MAWMSQGAAAAQGVELQVADQGPYGDHLIDAQGMSLYLFEGDGELESTCYDACAKAWPPLLTKGEATAGQGVDELMLTTVKRKDGSTQAAYNGHPVPVVAVFDGGRRADPAPALGRRVPVRFQSRGITARTSSRPAGSAGLSCRCW